MTPPTKAKPAWEWPNSTMQRAVDGDTFVAIVTKDIGFGGSASFQMHFRLDGVNAPKLGSVPGGAGALARDALAALLAEPFTIASHKPYKYGGEWMATVSLADGRDCSKAMIDAGHAVAWDGHGPRPGDE